MATELERKTEEFRAKQTALQELFKEGWDDSTKSFNSELVISIDDSQNEINRRNAELNDLGEELERLKGNAKADADQKAREKWLRDPINRPDIGGGEDKSEIARSPEEVAKAFVDGPAFKQYRGGTGEPMHAMVELKTLFQTTNGWAPESTRGPTVPYPTRPIEFLDRLPQVPTVENSIKYMAEDAVTDPTSLGISEGDVYPESAFSYSEQTVNVETFGAFVPVTDVILQDVPGIEGLITNNLTRQIRRHFEWQILRGNGTSPNLRGLLNVSDINTQAKTGDESIYHTLGRSIQDVKDEGKTDPDLILMTTADWHRTALLQLTTGAFFPPGPSEAIALRVWGIPVVEVNSLPEGTAVVGDFGGFSVVRDRRDVTIQIQDRFRVSSNLSAPMTQKTIRGDIRAAFVVSRPQAFTTATGLNT